jgi:hypothetical protein
MPRVVVTHAVEDVGKWLEGKHERAEAIAAIGGANVVDHVASDGSNAIAITCDSDDVETMLAAVNAPPAEMAAAMQRHGVIPPLTVYVER